MSAFNNPPPPQNTLRCASELCISEWWLPTALSKSEQQPNEQDVCSDTQLAVCCACHGKACRNLWVMFHSE
jgi:hypothetical protein